MATFHFYASHMKKTPYVVWLWSSENNFISLLEGSHVTSS